MYSEATCGLQAQQVSLSVQHKPLLQEVSLQLLPGQVGAILGPNGAGKSTLLNILAGLKVPQTGQVLLDGQALRASHLPALACRRAVLEQDTSVAFDFSAQEVVELGRYPHRLRPSLHEAQIIQTAMALTDTLHLAERRMAWLSGGERLRVQLARCLAQIWEPASEGKTRWLLLDEPTAALDLQHQHAVLATVRQWADQQGVGVLMVLHDLNLALRYTDQVWVLERGQLRAAGASHQVLTSAFITDVWQVQAIPVMGQPGPMQLVFDRVVSLCKALA